MVQNMDNVKSKDDKQKLEKIDYAQVIASGIETTQEAVSYDMAPMSIDALEQTVLDFDVFPEIRAVSCSDIIRINGQYGASDNVIVTFKPIKPIKKAYIQETIKVKETIDGKEVEKNAYAEDKRGQPVLKEVENYEGEIGIFFKIGKVENLETLETPNGVLEYYWVTNRMRSYPFLRVIASRQGLIDINDKESSVKFFKNLVLEIVGTEIRVDFESSPGSKRLRIGGENFKLLNEI